MPQEAPPTSFHSLEPPPPFFQVFKKKKKITFKTPFCFPTPATTPLMSIRTIQKCVRLYHVCSMVRIILIGVVHAIGFPFEIPFPFSVYSTLNTLISKFITCRYAFVLEPYIVTHWCSDTSSTSSVHPPSAKRSQLNRQNLCSYRNTTVSFAVQVNKKKEKTGIRHCHWEMTIESEK